MTYPRCCTRLLVRPVNLLSRLLRKAGAQATPAPDARPGVAATIDRALDAAGLLRNGDSATGIRATIDNALAASGLASRASTQVDASTVPVDAPRARQNTTQANGTMARRTFANAAGRRDYRLYIPTGYDALRGPLPLLVMLHGCTQSPEDFATGTRMNALADAQGVIVVYPEQAASANGSKCWNWFRGEDQQTGRGEPSLLAGIVREVAGELRVDTQRIFVAGLSAGAAMAVVLGRTDPDLFAGIGVHSGVPYGVANDVGSAFAAMQGRGVAREAASPHSAVPTIIFHGDRDHTVSIQNADAVMRDAVAAAAGPLHEVSDSGTSVGGRAWSRRTLSDASGRPHVENWTLQGAGHAWSGGSAHGSYTDPAGPDASAEMLRFFLQQHSASSKA